MGGAINTRQSQRVYAEDPNFEDLVEAWSDFEEPNSHVRHGVWVDDPDSYNAKQTDHGWRSWTEGLDPSELDADGNVKIQRLGNRKGRYKYPDGTKTYYHSTTTLSTGLHTADFENELRTATAPPASQQSSNIVGGTDRIIWASTTSSGEPDSAAWPTGTYRAQLDVTSVGHFARVNAALSTELETKAQAEGAFSGTGLKLATTGSVSWSSGTSTDRFEITIVAASGASHGNQKITLELNETDDFVDGPWVVDAVQGNVIFFGMNF
jgi:hypothetical protein